MLGKFFINRATFASPQGVTLRATHLTVCGRVSEGILIGFHSTVVIFLREMMFPNLDANGGCQLILEGDHFRLLQRNPLQYPRLEVQGLGETKRVGFRNPEPMCQSTGISSVPGLAGSERVP